MQGPPMHRPTDGYRVRGVTMKDVEACNRLCTAVHGHHRGGELVDAINDGSAVAAERGGRIAAYATGLGFFLHAVAETNEDLQALIAAAKGIQGPGVFGPARN